MPVFVFFFFFAKLIHGQLWISLARFQTARSKHLILSKGLDFQLVDRERNWDDHVILNGLLFYLANLYLPALHHHFRYSRYHCHHHSSVFGCGLFGQRWCIPSDFLFAIPFLTMVYTRTASIIPMAAYLTYTDFMNNMGHCNYEFIPKCLFQCFPFLNYIMYTPSYHSLHHSRVHANFCLFMPIYDYMYNTVEKSTKDVYENAIEGREQAIDVLHLTHPTTLHSIYQMHLGFASLAAQPQVRKWYLWLLWPITVGLMSLMWIFDHTFTVEKNRLEKLNIQTWAIPRFSFQDESLNANGELYVEKLKGLKMKLVDGCTLAAACVLNSIPPDTDEVLIQGHLSKTGYIVAMALCKRGIKGTIFIPFSQFPLKMIRKDCTYLSTPAMIVPSNLENMHSCENWLPRRVMSAWRVGGILNALEGRETHGDTMLDLDKVWSSALNRGFLPFP
ncbi:hypothetical protein AMTRI_Chr09g34380 [Amborella trichopoda]